MAFIVLFIASLAGGLVHLAVKRDVTDALAVGGALFVSGLIVLGYQVFNR